MKKKRPEGEKEFSERFMTDLENGLNDVSKEFPEYSDILMELIQFWNIITEVNKEDILSKKEYIMKIKEIFGKLYEAVLSDKDFREAYAEAVVNAYMANLNVLTNVNSFLKYLNSIAAERIILLDAIDVFEVHPDNKKLIANLIVTDLANNNYSPINISLEFSLKKELSIPIYSIFEWSKKN